MTEHDEARLPEAAEALLENWPAPVRDDASWDKLAGGVQASIATVEAGSTDDALLAAPLPASDGEGSPEATLESGPRVRDSQPGRPSQPGIGGKSLAQIAAGVATPKRDDDADPDIARESLSFSSRSRPSAGDIAATLAARRSSPSIPPPAAPVPSVEPAAPAPVAAKRSRGGAMVGGVIAVLALAAGLVVVMGNRKSSEPAVAVNDNVATAPATPQAMDQAKQEHDVVSPGQLPNGAPRPAAAPTAIAAHGAAPARSGTKVAAAAPEDPPVGSITLAETPEPAPAAAPKDKQEPGTPAAGENVPDKPGSGDIQAAIASVLGGARACVAGQDEPSRAVIVFGSDGRVQSVSVSGPAAATPSAGCIRAALSRAHVHRFARPSFSVGTPIRP